MNSCPECLVPTPNGAACDECLSEAAIGDVDAAFEREIELLIDEDRDVSGSS